LSTAARRAKAGQLRKPSQAARQRPVQLNRESARHVGRKPVRRGVWNSGGGRRRGADSTPQARRPPPKVPPVPDAICLPTFGPRFVSPFREVGGKDPCGSDSFRTLHYLLMPIREDRPGGTGRCPNYGLSA